MDHREGCDPLTEEEASAQLGKLAIVELTCAEWASRAPNYLRSRVLGYWEF